MTARIFGVNLGLFLLASAGAFASSLSPLAEACRLGDLAAFDRALASAAPSDVQKPDLTSYGRTPLHWAITAPAFRAKDRLAIVKELLDHGADVNALSKRHETPLSLSVSIDWDKALVDELIKRKASVAGIGRSEEESPIALAVATGNVEAVETMLPYLSDPTVQVPQDASLLFLLSRAITRWPVDPDQLNRSRRIVNFLLKNGAAEKFSPGILVRLAASTNDVELFSLIANWTHDVRATGGDGKTVLHQAVIVQGVGDVNFIKLLSRWSGYGVDVQDRDGNTPLHVAVDAQNSAGVIALLQAGADPTIRNSAGQLPGKYYGSLNREAQDLLKKSLELARSRDTPPGSTPAPVDSDEDSKE